MPIGVIVGWSSSFGAIPPGWVECDGVQNFPGPDLRDRFIVGASGLVLPVHPIDTSGGSYTHTHATHIFQGSHQHDAHGLTGAGSSHNHTGPAGHSAHAALATHFHELPFQLPNATPARHIPQTVFGTGTSRAGQRSIATGASTTAAVVALSEAKTAGAPDAHSAHGVTGSETAHTHSGPAIHAAGGSHQHDAHDTPDHQPPWYALFWIQQII